MMAGRADTSPLFPDDPYIAANRRVTITLMREELRRWMESHEFAHIDDFRGRLIDGKTDKGPARGRYVRVYSNGNTTWDLKWTNDTPYPIVIIARTTPGSRSTITIELWSRPIDRTVTFTGLEPVDINGMATQTPVELKVAEGAVTVTLPPATMYLVLMAP